MNRNRNRNYRPSVLLPSEPRPENPLPYAVASLLLAAADVGFLYRLAETPYEFLAILALTGITFFAALEALSRI
jgi:hypothetical protein